MKEFVEALKANFELFEQSANWDAAHIKQEIDRFAATWRPVEFDGPGDWRIKIGECRTEPDRYGRHWHLVGASWTPTHWMPLPGGPKE